LLNGTSGGEQQGMQETVKHAEREREREGGGDIGPQKKGTEGDRNSERRGKNLRNVGMKARMTET